VNIAAVMWPDLLNVHEDKHKQHHISWIFFSCGETNILKKIIYSEATHGMVEFGPLL